MKSRFLIASVLMASSLPAVYAADSELKSDKEKFSYAVGVQIGQDLKRNGMDIDAAALAMAVEDITSGKALRLTGEEMQAIFMDFQQKQAAKQELAASANRAEGEKFLAENKTKTGVVELPSGLQYKVITAGSGKQPTATDSVSVHYRGTLLNGTEFDSSYSRGQPASFPVNGVIKGWTEALQLMKEGAKWQLFIPSDLAYGLRGAGGDIGPNAVLQFEVELLEVK